MYETTSQTEITMQTYSYGTTPKNLIKIAVQAICNGRPYVMKMVGREAELIEGVVNQGIDSHLEACFMPHRGDSYTWVAATPSHTQHLSCCVSAESMPVLLRRLSELNDDKAISLRIDILGTLDIEEI